ncbi:MAG: nitrilase [Propionibacteriales bacterium]|nr:nitrilase [Propionibacteriales bacterium]
MQVAVVQDGPTAFDRESTLVTIDARTREAASAGAGLVLFPEAFIGGYPRGSTFSSVIGARDRSGYQLYRRYWESAVDVPGEMVDRLADLATELGVFLVIGVMEREGGTLFCTVLFFGPEGYLGKHRKLIPTGLERAVWGRGDGSTLPVFDTPAGRMGAVICWENYMPLLRMAMYDKGVQLYLAPTADSRDTWVATMRHIAVEGRCYVLGCNQFTRRGDYPPEMDSTYGDDPDTIVTRGGSCIIDPYGQVLAGPLYDEAGILYADVDPGETRAAKFDFEVAGHYARPDVFQLSVNETRQLSTVRHDEGEESR